MPMRAPPKPPASQVWSGKRRMPSDHFDGRRFFNADDDHLSDAGAAEAREMFERVIRIGVGANEGDVGGHAGGPRPDR